MRNVLTLLQEAVARFPAHQALMWKNAGQYHTMTYEELWQLVQSFAYGLQELGVRVGSKVAILSGNSPAWAVGDFGILACGAVTVPVYQTLTTAQIAFILQNADVEVILVENSELAEKVRAVATEDIRYIIKMSAKTDADPPELLSYHQVLDSGYTRLEEQGPLTTWETIGENDLATIVHTSGTTGNPKGVMLTHHNLVTNIEGTLAYVPMLPTDLTLSYLPLSHIFERTCGQFAVLACGATICYAESIATIADNLLEVHPTTMTSVPRLFEKIYDGVQKNIRDSSAFTRWLFKTAVQNGRKRMRKKSWVANLLHPLFDKLVFSKIRAKTGGNLRLLVSGGAPLNPVVAEFFTIAGLPVCEGYGMTETAPVIATNPTADLRVGTVGKPLANL
ncbi:MAG: AMP-dependent synthetase/ligase, partial [Tumebacillaceae bacterium]